MHVQKHHWRIKPSQSRITTASKSLISVARGYYFTATQRDYIWTRQTSCEGKAVRWCPALARFPPKHKRVDVFWDGDKPMFSICSLAAAQVEPQSLWKLRAQLLAYDHKIPQHPAHDDLSLWGQISKSLSMDTTEPSKLLERARVLVTSNGRHKIYPLLRTLIQLRINVPI